MIILGLNAFHGDSSAAIVRNGLLVAAVEEERFKRVKHWAGFPSQSIAYCLEEAGISLKDVDHIAINQNSYANIIGKLKYLILHHPNWKLLFSRLENRRKRANLGDLVTQYFPGEKFGGEFHYIEHHVAHLSSAFHVSPFDDAAIVSVDGFGDFCSAAWGVGSGTHMSIDDRVYFPHSLGIFYQAMTQYLGFPNYGDEYKVMGLAPYGKPSRMDAMRQIVKILPSGLFELNLAFFRHHKERIIFEWGATSPTFDDLFTDALEELLGPRRHPHDPLENRHHDIARSTQAMYEEAFFNLLNSLQSKHTIGNVALAGGCAMNSVANGKIRRATGFRRVYVQPAAGDAGGAIGAAFSVWHKTGGARIFTMDHAYWGPQYLTKDISELLENQATRIEHAGCIVEYFTDEAQLCERTAAAIADGQVVGWFQGRMEWGPRALGNRSILCDPRRSDMKHILNKKIKRRENFRPFAPSILAECVSEWFEEDDDVPFMMQVFQIREERRADLTAVTHIDGSGRLQSVRKSANPRYHALISHFYKLTGVPVLLNTSFNENEPIVCRPEEALDCFLRTNMDVLVMDNVFLTRRPGAKQEVSSLPNLGA